jgi:uncharacterized membrane protein
MSTGNAVGIDVPADACAPAADTELWKRLRMPALKLAPRQKESANDAMAQSLSPLDKLAIKITDKVGSVGFFLMILIWTVLWTGYNILATEFPGMHWKSFDPFPAFVAYLLISNVIQILLMPLIMVGQNLQGRHSELRAQMDFDTNQLAQKEVTMVLRHLEHQTDLIIKIMQHLECRVSEEELRAITAEHELAIKIANMEPSQAADA